MRNIDPDGEENQRQTRDNERYVGGLQLQAALECQHEWKRLPGVTSNNVKIIECQRCFETQEEDQK